jgi:hypothetical protein
MRDCDAGCVQSSFPTNSNFPPPAFFNGHHPKGNFLAALLPHPSRGASPYALQKSSLAWLEPRTGAGARARRNVQVRRRMKVEKSGSAGSWDMEIRNPALEKNTPVASTRRRPHALPHL